MEDRLDNIESRMSKIEKLLISIDEKVKTLPYNSDTSPIFTTSNAKLWVDENCFFRATYDGCSINTTEFYVEIENANALRQGYPQKTFKINTQLSRDQRMTIATTIKNGDRKVDIYYDSCYVRALP